MIVGVGGFLGAGEKDVAVNFNSIKQTMKNDKVYLTMDTTKDALKRAPGFKYDSTKTTWVPDTSSKYRRNHVLTLRKPRPCGSGLFSGSAAQISGPLRNFLIEILRDALEHARIDQGHRAVAAV